MSFNDLAAKFRQHAAKQADTKAEAPPNFEELYLVRARILGVLIQDARQAADLDTDTCAQRVGVARETFEAWEMGKAMPSLPQLELLAYAVGLPISHFWGTDLTDTYERQNIDSGEYVQVRNRLIGAMLRAARENAGLTPDQLARATGISNGHVTAYELGTRPIPSPVLVSLASACRVNMAYFLENGNRVGEFLLLQEDLKAFSALPDTLRQFIAQPINQPYLEIARKLAEMGTSELREIATSILDITL